MVASHKVENSWPVVHCLMPQLHNPYPVKGKRGVSVLSLSVEAKEANSSIAIVVEFARNWIMSYGSKLVSWADEQ